MGNLNKIELHACGQQLATSFATILLTFVLLVSILISGGVINFKTLLNEELKLITKFWQTFAESFDNPHLPTRHHNASLRHA